MRSNLITSIAVLSTVYLLSGVSLGQPPEPPIANNVSAGNVSAGGGGNAVQIPAPNPSIFPLGPRPDGYSADRVSAGGGNRQYKVGAIFDVNRPLRKHAVQIRELPSNSVLHRMTDPTGRHEYMYLERNDYIVAINSTPVTRENFSLVLNHYARLNDGWVAIHAWDGTKQTRVLNYRGMWVKLTR